MEKLLGSAEKNRILDLSREVEIRLAELYPTQGIWVTIRAMLPFTWTDSKRRASWRWSREQLEAALQNDNAEEIAAQLNLQALNCAIEATRNNDERLKQLAHELLLLSQQARNLLVRQ